MTYEQALRKVKACLRLAADQGASPDESALAAARAQEIMNKYNIAVAAADLDAPQQAKPEEAIHDYDNESVLDACQKDMHWARRLVGIVAEANGCKSYWRSRNMGCANFLIGRISDVQTTRYMCALLADEVRRLAREHTRGFDEKYRRDFKFGVVDAIYWKFREQWDKTKREMREEQAANPMALVRLNDAIARVEDKLKAVDLWSKLNTNLRPTKSTYEAHENARQHGQRVGRTVKLSQAKTGLNA